MEEATEEVAGAIMGDMLTAMAIMGDMDMVGGAILTGVIPTGGVTLMGGVIPTIPTTIPTTILITTGVMRNCRCLQKELLPRQHRYSSNLLIGTSVRIQKVTIPTLKIARVAG